MPDAVQLARPGHAELDLNTPGLLARFALGDLAGTVARDDVRNGNPGTYTGGYTLGAKGYRQNAGVKLDGVNGYVAVPYAAALRPTNFSAELMVSMSTVTGGWKPFLCTDSYTATTGWFLLYRPDVTRLIFAHAAGEGGDCFATWNPVVNTWYHIGITYDGTNGKLYLNGALYAGPTAVTITANTVTYEIGARHNNDGTAGPADVTPGTFLDVNIFTGVLTDSQMAAHASAALGD